jgi:hypothetical protein
MVRNPLRGIPTSRAYWELKAEQMVNRVFDPVPTIDLEIEESGRQDDPSAVPPQPPPAPLGPLARRLRPNPRPPSSAATNATPSHRPRRDSSVLLLATLGGVCMVSAASTVLFLNHWNQAQQSLREERNLLLVERLRSLGPASPTAAAPAEPSMPKLPGDQRTALSASGEAPPPPPEEPWIEELDSLPRGERAPAPLLRVPVSPRLAAAAPLPTTGPSRAATEGPPRAGGAPGAGPAPTLVGVVGAPGKAGSAIFQMGGSSTSVSVGESIGGSGWRLQAADGDSAVIERGGEVRQVSIGNGQ